MQHVRVQRPLVLNRLTLIHEVEEAPSLRHFSYTGF
jgi:hypothetical protein